jgi:hypothetical protein
MSYSSYFNCFMAGRFTIVLKTAFCFCCCVCAFLSLSASQTLAEPDNYKFYPHNYAKSPIDGSEANRDISGMIESKDGALVEGQEQATGQSSAALQQPLINEISGTKIEGLSLVASGIDADSLTKQLYIIIEIFNKKSVQPAQLYLIGQPDNPKPSDLKKIMKRVTMLGVEVITEIEPPAHLQISKVPTWILSLKDGDIVLEGLDSPDKFINSKGEFIEPEVVLDLEAEPTATPVRTAEPTVAGLHSN